ncbi:MAG: DMT family transporter, partial [Anaerolineales bacterium]
MRSGAPSSEPNGSRSTRLRHGTGFSVAVLSASLLGLTPILGKQAIQAGLSPLAVVSARTLVAAGLLAAGVLLFRRRALAIYPVGLVGCLIAGGLNGAGSLLYYSALARIDAGLGQILFSLHPVFVALVLYLDGQRPSRSTVGKLALGLVAVLLLTQTTPRPLDTTGVLLMLGAGALYGLHIPINQRVLYDVPAPTVTLYTLIAMTAVVVPVQLLVVGVPPAPQASLLPVAGLAAVTFLSRLTLFAGIQSIGGMQASLLGLLQLVVAVFLSLILLHESLSPLQWAGAILLGAVLLLPESTVDSVRTGVRRGWLSWIRPPVL